MVSRKGIGPGSAGRQMLYGLSTVRGALMSKYRRPGKLYCWGERTPELTQVQDLARERHIPVVEVEQRATLNRFSEHRPHNNVVLEMPPRNIRTIDDATWDEQGLHFRVGKKLIKCRTDIASTPSPPLIVALDGIIDPMNAGNIIRTSYAFGASAVITSAAQSAPLTPVLAKAASGALEQIDIYQVQSVTHFIDAVRANGFHVIATGVEARGYCSVISLGPRASMHEQSRLNALLARPRIVYFGSEGEGLRNSIVQRADTIINVPHHTVASPLVTSLNVASAAAIVLSRLAVDTRA